jgi:hypothetical protein
MDQMWRQDGVQRSVADNEMIGGEIASRQVVRAGGLIVVPGIVLRAVTNKQTVLVIEVMIEAARIAPVEVWSWNRGSRVRSHQGASSVLDDGELTERLRRDRNGGMLAFALESKEEKVLVTTDRKADVAAELLARELGRGTPGVIRSVLG